ncbi:MAG: class I SAM-dependent DNA methyltransferase [Chloroflexi bacterium]|nr:class I SAM-dependent DNA methyltransferase [Chloroflexota bacterium]
MEFAARWQGSTLSERSAAQSHFIDLCHMLDVPTPSEADPRGEWYAFEKGAEKTGGGDGFADVWKRGHFAWEYKGKRKDLKAAYRQLLQYREALENPPLLVVCDLDRFEVHTNFTNTPTVVHSFDLADLARDPKEPLRVLRAVMRDPEALRPARTRREITEEAAREFAALASAVRSRGYEPQRVAHFLNKLLFCMFAEDAGLLPRGLLMRLAEGAGGEPEVFAIGLADLFGKMSDKGGLFGAERIQWFNGGLFDGADVIPLTAGEIRTVHRVSQLDWSQVEPAIFGTLFERGLDPGKRSQLGAHYTDRLSIDRLVEAVLLVPLRRDFEDTKGRITALLAEGQTVRRVTRRTPAERNPQRLMDDFLARLRATCVLDPACGSGNFLYIALHALKDLEREAILWASVSLQIPLQFPQVGPQNLRGIELNPYAAELARVVIWIGEIQWMLANGFSYLRDPILRPLDNIECRDAVLDLRDPEHPREPAWPLADVIVGNPPFLGVRLMRGYLGDAYVDALFKVYAHRVPSEADYVCYWFEKARAMAADGHVRRVGLLATQGIRGGANRRVLDRIKAVGNIFMARSDDPWVLEGAAVHVSFIAFDNGSEPVQTLNGKPVVSINPNLTAGVDLTKARRLPENLGIAFQGVNKVGPFEIPGGLARRMLAESNPDGRSNADVIRPWVNGLDVTRRMRDMWIIDFGVDTPPHEAALYETPFEYVREHVLPVRATNRRGHRRERWWLHGETIRGLRSALADLPRFIVTPTIAKHRLFLWIPAGTLPDHQLIAFACEDDYTFGILHSHIHEVWALRMGTQLEDRPRYTPRTTFETFPFPPPADERSEAIAAAARTLDSLRQGWLTSAGADPQTLQKRTLTHLYNERPTWLALAHRKLDDAVFDAYGWAHDLSDEQIVERLLALNLERASAHARETS